MELALNPITIGLRGIGGQLRGLPSPVLDLDFAGTKTLDSRVTFTRASNATYFDANGVLQTAGNNVARFDHNPTTLQSLGLLIEEQRTNLLLYSEQFDNAAWGKTNCSITANTIVAPDGTLTGDKLVDNTTNGFHRTSQTPAVTSGTSYTFSVYLKAAEITRVTLQIGSAFFTQTLTNFNLSSGTIASGTGTITAVGNGWYRCSNTATATSTGAGEFFVELTDASGNRQYAGNGSNGVFVWGCQVEAGAFPTSYIPTTTAAATRNADVASMTGTNFSSWYNATEGAFYSESVVARQVAIASTGVFSAIDVSGGDLISTFYRASGATGFNVNDDSIVQADLTPTGVLSANTVAKIGVAYKANDFAASGNGGAVGTDTSGTVPVIDRMNIGLRAAYLNGHIRRIAYYPVRLSNAQLQALTR